MAMTAAQKDELLRRLEISEDADAMAAVYTLLSVLTDLIEAMPVDGEKR